MNRELRSIGTVDTVENRHITGYAAVFDKQSKDLGGFIEIIDKGAFNGVIEASDVLCLLNHEESRGVLARSKYGKGSLKLSIDETGLKYEFEAPGTQLGNELLEGLKRGDITTSSFAFCVEDEYWEELNGTNYRHIKKIKYLFDVSPVYIEAYPDTSVAQRNLSDFIQYKADFIKEYYKNIKNKYNL